MSADFTANVPEEIMSHAFDHLHLDELLLCAMPTCKRWRAAALEQPLYWRDVALANLRGDKHRRLFFLRLQRSLDRPIHVTIDAEGLSLDVIRELLGAVAAKSADLVSLRLFLPGWLMASGPHPFTSPAPLLEVFQLCYYMTPEVSHQLSQLDVHRGLEEDWFADDAPLLRELYVENVSMEITPRWTAQIARFTYKCTASTRSLSARMPGILMRYPKMTHLVFGGNVCVQQGCEGSRELWSPLRCFDASNIHSDFVELWDWSRFPLDRVQEVRLPAAVTDSCLQWLKGSFCLNNVRLSIIRSKNKEDTICLAFEMPSHGRETTRREIPEQRWNDIERIAEQTCIMARVVSLHIDFESWPDMLRYCAELPMLQELTMLLRNPRDVLRAEPRTMGPSYPELSSVRLTVNGNDDGTTGPWPEPLTAASIVFFVQKVVLPECDTSSLHLCLKDVWVTGSPVALLDQFKSVEFNPMYRCQTEVQ